jgi:hypothetical protein
MSLPWNIVAAGPIAAATIAACLLGCSSMWESEVSIESIQTDSAKQEVPVKTATTTSAAAPMTKMAIPNAADIVFKDQVESNVAIPDGLDGLVFLDTQGNRVSLEGYLGKKNVVLVFTEGFAGGMLCSARHKPHDLLLTTTNSPT